MRNAPRLYSPEEVPPLREGISVVLAEEQVHYLARVLRHAAGDRLRLFNPRDGEFDATIVSLPKRGAGACRIEALRRDPVVEHGPTLLFAPLKRDATDLAVRMATELGVSEIRPVLTERTNSQRVNSARLRLIAIEAAEQCERLSVPAIAEPVPLAAVLSSWPDGCTLWAAIERVDTAWGARVEPGRPVASDALLIGPEGGFAPTELDVLRARHFVTPISLGSRILKAETAIVAGLACLQAARETWGFEKPV